VIESPPHVGDCQYHEGLEEGMGAAETTGAGARSSPITATHVTATKPVRAPPPNPLSGAHDHGRSLDAGE